MRRTIRGDIDAKEEEFVANDRSAERAAVPLVVIGGATLRGKTVALSTDSADARSIGLAEPLPIVVVSFCR